MGISGLLPVLKEIQVPRNISDFKGQRLAVDAYVWLHRGAFGCAEDLVKGRKTTRFVDYAMNRVGMLRHHGITPYVVFDGGPLPAKRGTEVSRAKSRSDNLARAYAYEAQGRLKEARDCYTKCIDITPEMAYQLIKALRAESIDYVVAPYEADAQLCFLEREGFVDGVITEDSDLLVFGCQNVVFKLDKDGSCVSIDGSRMALVRELPMHGWTDLEFRRMAMLSGCDYLPSIPGIGLKKAHRMLRRYKTVEKSLQALRLEGSHTIPPGYAAAFSRAELAFLYQRVFCPSKRRLVTLTELPDAGLSADDEAWVGLDVEVEIAQGMATGDIHPETREPIEDQWPAFKPAAGMYVKKRPDSAAGAAGTLDGVFKPIKRVVSAPRRVPRLGEMSSGPTRLSNITTGPERRALEQTPSPRKPVKTSKFFGKGVTEQEPEHDLQWDESLASTIPSPKTDQLSPEALRSPSVSTQNPTPTRTDDAGHLTSPVSDRSPGFSSSQSVRTQTNDHRPEPSSPTPAARFGSPETCATFGTARDSQSSDGAESRPLQRLTSVLDPRATPSSMVQPLVQHPRPRSSDSAPEDELVTPSPIAKFPHAGFPVFTKRPRQEQDDEGDGEAAARAQTVAQGWREKYALGGGSSPGPVMPQRPKAKRPRASLPISAGAGILTSRSVNIPTPAVPSKPSKPKPAPSRTAKTQAWPQVQHAAPARKPPPAVQQPPTPNPHGLTWAALERFRFSRG